VKVALVVVVFLAIGIGVTLLLPDTQEVVTATTLDASTSTVVTTTTTTAPATTTTVTLPPPATGTFKTRSGIFNPGWITCGQTAGVYYQVTFVSPMESEGVLAHRIGQMECDDNVPIVYMEMPLDPDTGHINQINNGEFDEFIDEWFAQYFALCDTSCILAPLAEMNGRWVPWYTDVPAEYHAAYAHLQALAAPYGETTWAYAPSQVVGWKEYAPANFDLLLPSIFAPEDFTALDVISRATTMGDFFGVEVIIGQTGTLLTGTLRDEWITELHRLASRDRVLGIAMFDCTCADGHPYAYPGGLLNSAVYQEVLNGTQN
jgi:hypothetical protein